MPDSVLSHGPLHAPGLLLDRALRVPLAAVVPPLVADGHGVGLVPGPRSSTSPASSCASRPAGLIAPRRLMLGWHAARRRTALLEDAFCDAAVRAFLDADLVDPARAA